MDKSFTVSKWTAYIFLVMAGLNAILGVYGIGWGIYQGFKQNWELVLTIVFTLPFVFGLVAVFAWIAGQLESVLVRTIKGKANAK